jgi:CBS domain-containing protein
VRLMASEDVHRAVVVDEHGKLAGIVSTMDVLRALARGEDLQGDDSAFLDRHEHHADPESVCELVDLTRLDIEARSEGIRACPRPPGGTSSG